MNKLWHFESLWQDGQWLSPAYLLTDQENKIISLSGEPPEQNETPTTHVSGWSVPGIPNAHSHAFQYAMVGMTEHQSTKGAEDNFWTWREAMYDLALTLQPEQVKEIATQLYKKMRLNGYTSVAEFHYLHHDVNGKRYFNLAQMGEAICEAAREAKIDLTLVPVFYRQGNFGEAASIRQRRFTFKNVDEYFRLIEATKQLTQQYGFRYGIGVHSMRAASAEDLARVFSEWEPNVPKHIHIAEQVKEVEDCLSFYGKRPVEWMASQGLLDENCHLVHATHINEAEMQQIVKSKANVVLCPSTEGNLGDGFFPLWQFEHSGGRWCIGSDSHVGLSPMEELRWVDYGQRLSQKKRNGICQKPEDSSGDILFSSCVTNGRRALGKALKSFELNEPLDFLNFDTKVPPQFRLSTLVYGSLDSFLKMDGFH